MTEDTPKPHPKLAAALADMSRTMEAAQANPQAVLYAVQDCVKAMKRIASRAAPLPAEFERIEIVQSFGPVIEFSGRQLAGAEFGRVSLELWETPAGAWIAVSRTDTPAEGEMTSATVIPPGDDQQARQFAAMEQWRWMDRARRMVRDLGWKLKLDVE